MRPLIATGPPSLRLLSLSHRLVNRLVPTSLSLENSVQQLQTQIQELQSNIKQTQIQDQARQDYIQQLQTQLQESQSRVHELEARLAKDSTNSSKPPSSDGLKCKRKSTRKRSGKKSGGQKGHTGKGLAQVDKPDIEIPHQPPTCSGCGFELRNTSGDIAEKRQVYDIPQPIVVVTEHQVVEKKCPCCNKLTRGVPKDVKGPVQYGDRIRALIAYFLHQHYIPVDRVCEVLTEVPLF